MNPNIQVIADLGDKAPDETAEFRTAKDGPVALYVGGPNASLDKDQPKEPKQETWRDRPPLL
jgi:hypothetical protein